MTLGNVRMNLRQVTDLELDLGLVYMILRHARTPESLILSDEDGAQAGENWNLRSPPCTFRILLVRS